MLKVIAIESNADRFDLLDPFNRVFWRNMTAEDAIEAANRFGSLYRIVEHTGADYGVKVVA